MPSPVSSTTTSTRRPESHSRGLAKIQSAVRDSGPGSSKDKAYVTKVTEKNVRDSIHEIRERSSILRELIDSGKVGIAGAMYDVSTGAVTFLAD